MLKTVDKYIDKITMYRLLLYYLGALLVIATGLSAIGVMHYGAIKIIISTGILITACWLINKVFSYIFDAPTNYESSILTALILALIITPNPTGFGLTFLLAASGLAMASKYILTIRDKHIFNPAAIAVALMAIGPKQSATWWVGTLAMLPYVLIGGIILTRKIRRSRMVIAFFITSTIATIFFTYLVKGNVLTAIHSLIASSPLFFLGFVMLSEPLTSPATEKKQTIYGAIVGALLPPQVHIFNFYSSPEIALLIGNVFSYIVSPKAKLFPSLIEKVQVAASTYDFVFKPGRKFAFRPGQYIEWTLPHTNTDSRGNRRIFTIASSPTENNIRIGVKFYKNGSTFKEALLGIDSSTLISASQIAGDFTLPKNRNQKLAFIAGGIGVTPFRSMVKYLIDKNEARNVRMLYSSRTTADLAYKDLFEEARVKLGMDTSYILNDIRQAEYLANVTSGKIDKILLTQAIPDYMDRVFYISGTHPMVEAIQEILHELGVHHSKIKIDFFPGYA